MSHAQRRTYALSFPLRPEVSGRWSFCLSGAGGYPFLARALEESRCRTSVDRERHWHQWPPYSLPALKFQQAKEPRNTRNTRNGAL